MITAAVTTPAIPPDPVLDGARGLFLDDGPGSIDRFLSDRTWTMQDVRAVQALYRPGSACAVRYRVRALDPLGAPRLLTITAETRAETRRLLDPGPRFQERYRLQGPVEHAAPYLIWVFPYDPALKGLEEAAWGPAVAGAIAELEQRPRAVRVQPLRYRPTRRALFRYQALYGNSGSSRIVYGKVLRTLRAESSLALADALARRPRRLARRPAAPGYLSLPETRMNKNVLLFRSMAGRSLRDLLLAGEPLPKPERIAGLMGSLQQLGNRLEGVESARHARSWQATLDSSVSLLTHLLPEMSPDVQKLGEGIARAAGGASIHRAVVHGDLYDAQVLVRDDFSLGLVDVDDVGVGDPAMDAANFTTHLLALAHARPAAKSRLLAYRSLVRRSFLDELDVAPRDLAWREALVMLQLATGPFRVLVPNWPDRMAQHIATAGRLLERG